MPGKATVIELNADMTFKEVLKATDENSVKISSGSTPSFSLGRSVFREIKDPLNWKRYIPFMLRNRKPRNLILHLNGANSCFELSDKLKSNQDHLWSKKEKEKFVSKIIAKSKSEQKLIDTTQFYIILVCLGLVILLQIIIGRGAHVF